MLQPNILLELAEKRNSSTDENRYTGYVYVLNKTCAKKTSNRFTSIHVNVVYSILRKDVYYFLWGA